MRRGARHVVGTALGLLVAFVLTTPVNRWAIGRGRGHAVVHAHHH
jgi:fructose-specific phosphotransferase system IIC component